MTSSNPPNFARQILLLTAGIFLFVAPQAALAKHKDHSDDHGGMSSNDSSHDQGDEHSDDHKDKNKDHAEKDMKSDKHKGKHKHDEESALNGMDLDKHKGKHKDKDKEYAEDGTNSEKHKGKHKDKESADKDKTTDTASTTDSNAPPATNDGKKPTDITPIDQGSASDLGAMNAIHPIASPTPHKVTISNGVNSLQIDDGAGGVTVSSNSPGTITVSNGHDSQTLSGGTLTVSGALGIGSGNGVQVGPTNGEGKTVIALTPPPPPPAAEPSHVISHPGILSGISDAIGDGLDSVGHGIADAAGHLDPVPTFTAHAPDGE